MPRRLALWAHYAPGIIRFHPGPSKRAGVAARPGRHGGSAAFGVDIKVGAVRSRRGTPPGKARVAGDRTDVAARSRSDSRSLSPRRRTSASAMEENGISSSKPNPPVEGVAGVHAAVLVAEDEVRVLPGRAGGQPCGGLAFSVGLEGGYGALGEFERALGLGVS